MLANNALTGTARYVWQRKEEVSPPSFEGYTCILLVKNEIEVKKNLTRLIFVILFFLTQIIANYERETKEADN